MTESVTHVGALDQVAVAGDEAGWRMGVELLDHELLEERLLRADQQERRAGDGEARPGLGELEDRADDEVPREGRLVAEDLVGEPRPAPVVVPDEHQHGLRGILPRSTTG